MAVPDRTSSFDGGTQSSARWRLAVPVTAVALLGTTLTASVVALQYQAARQSTIAAAEAALDHSRGHAGQALQTMYGVMESVAGLFQASGVVTRREFRIFAREIIKSHPELKALQYSELVHPADRAAFERRLKAAGTGFRITQPTPAGKLVPAARRDNYIAIVYTVPEQPNRLVFGLDIAYRAENRALIQTAVVTGDPQIGAPHRLVQGGRALHIYVPVFRPDTTPRTPQQRWDALRGIAGAALLYEQVMDDAVSSETATAADIALVDPRIPEADAGTDADIGDPDSPVIWASTTGVTPAAIAGWPLRENLHFAGGTLELVARPSAASGGWRWRPLLSAVVGSAITLLACALVWYWVDARRYRRQAGELQAAHDRLTYLAGHDSLTGLPNRDALRQWASAWQSAHPDGCLAVFFVDLDDFKHVNNSRGHLGGDHVLRAVARRLADAVDGPHAVVGRLGGDEFLVVAGVPEPESATVTVTGLSQAILDSLVPVVTVQDQDHEITASVGTAVQPADGTTLEDLLRCADTAVRTVKRSAKGTAAAFTAAMGDQMLDQQQLESDVRRATRECGAEFRMAYQPIVELASGRVVAAEALLRWESHPASPTRFVAAAERTGVIRRLGDWVLDEVCRQLAGWRATGLAVPLTALNVAAQQLDGDGFGTRIAQALAQHDLPPGSLELEVTESTAMAEGAAEQLAEIRATGVKIAIDDFGTGFSSLSRLSELPADQVKIDRSFTSRVSESEDALEIVRAIVALAQALDLDVVAEGVETEAQRRVLLAEGVRYGQGFLFAPAVPSAQFPAIAGAALMESVATRAPAP